MNVAGRIQQLARSTNASAAFVGHVERLLALQGVALQADATPFETLLDRTFLREAALHAHAQTALEDLRAWRASLERSQAAQRQQLGTLAAIQASLDGSLRKLRACARALPLRAKNRAAGPPWT